MGIASSMFAVAPPLAGSFSRFLHLPVFGVIATTGVLAALLLSERTARYVGLSREQMWDAGIFIVASAFLCSRLLLVATNLKLFIRHPMLVLLQPSLTMGALALTALLVLIYLRRNGLPLLQVLDVWAAPGALLAAALEIGHFFEGTEAGMPTTLPWGVRLRNEMVLGPVHPVQLYAAAGECALCLWLLHVTRRTASRSGKNTVSTDPTSRNPLLTARAGDPASLGLLAGGALSFFLGFLRQPATTLGGAWLDPAQYAALLAILAGTMLHLATRQEASATEAIV